MARHDYGFVVRARVGSGVNTGADCAMGSGFPLNLRAWAAVFPPTDSAAGLPFGVRRKCTVSESCWIRVALLREGVSVTPRSAACAARCIGDRIMSAVAALRTSVTARDECRKCFISGPLNGGPS